MRPSQDQGALVVGVGDYAVVGRSSSTMAPMVEMLN